MLREGEKGRSRLRRGGEKSCDDFSKKKSSWGTKKGHGVREGFRSEEKGNSIRFWRKGKMAYQIVRRRGGSNLIERVWSAVVPSPVGGPFYENGGEKCARGGRPHTRKRECP